MSQDERKDIIQCISGILTSTPNRMTVRQLNTDFINTVGYRIPFEKFGYPSLEHFLRSLDDKVQVKGTGQHAEVQILVSNKVAHINELVVKQRAAKQRPRSFHNRYIPTFSRRNFSTYVNHYATNVPQTKQISNVRNNSTYPNTKNVANNSTYTNTTNATNNFASTNATNNFTSTNTTNVPYDDNIDVKTRTSNLRPVSITSDLSNKGAVPKYPKDNSTNSDELFFSDEEDNTKVPQNIQDNLRKLILKCPDGVWSSNMLECYRKEFGQALRYGEYGYRSVAQMCADLRNIFNILQLDKSDIKLFAKNKTIPVDTVNIVKKLQLMRVKADVGTPTENAIPVSDVEEIMNEICNEQAPPDVVPFGFKIPRQWVPADIDEQSYIDINVAEIYDPSKFWLNLKVFAAQLNTLMDNIQTFYMGHKEKLRVPYYALRKDLYVACMYANEFHRARIIDTVQKNEYVIKVHFIDYGTVSVIAIDSVYYLHNQFSELYEQGIRARLAGIYPPTENEQWSRAAASRFLELVKQKDLLAQIVKIDNERLILDVVLADTTEEDEEVFINDALVSMGFASFTFQVNCESSKSDSSSQSNESSSINAGHNISKSNKKTSLTPKEIMQILKSRS